MRINKFKIAFGIMFFGAGLILASFIISVCNLIYILIATHMIPRLMIIIFFIGLGFITIGIIIGNNWLHYTDNGIYPNDPKKIHDIREIDGGE